MIHNKPRACTGTDSSHWSAGKAVMGNLPFLAQVSDAVGNQTRIALGARDRDDLAGALRNTARTTSMSTTQGRIVREDRATPSIYRWSVVRDQAGIAVCFHASLHNETSTVRLCDEDACDFAADLMDVVPEIIVP